MANSQITQTTHLLRRSSKPDPASDKSTFRHVVLVLFLINAGTSVAALAQQWSLRRVLLLSICGIFLGELWFDLVCWYGKVWPIQLVYSSPVWYLIGGGPSVGASLLFVLVANTSPARRRPSQFFLLEASAYSGSVLGYLASSATMDKTLWGSISIGLNCIAASLWLVVDVSDQRNTDAQLAAQADESPKSTDTTLHAAMLFSQRRGRLALLLFGLLLRSLGVSVMRLLAIYTSQVFDWPFSRSGYFASLDSTTHLLILVLLPTVDRFLVSGGRSPAEISKAFALARGSKIAVMGIVDTVGSLVGAHLWPLVYRVGLQLGGAWAGLPFLATAALFVAVYATLLMPTGHLNDAI
ncbi:uncharacterized protein BDV14DRAFT_198345 [Aspergillus stella-maris]|uniref:uncharacterized protein n=1 Tax=Aspergillus stella-maris TaxID=1810926 RepID=UPI003CCCCD64